MTEQQQYGSLREKIRAEKGEREKRTAQFAAIYAEAVKAGREAVSRTHVQPMIVGEETAPFSGVLDTSRPMHFIEDGACGFAWVIVRPGNSPFANWLKKEGHARKDSYYGGVNIWIGDYNQSVQKKAVHAKAMAEVFRKHGITAQSYDRLD